MNVTSISKNGSNDVIAELLNLVAAVRSGEIIGITVVTTTKEGAVEMRTIAAPLIACSSRSA